jgi:hypothetical protein
MEGGTFSAKNLIGTEKRPILNAAGLPLAAAVGRVEIVYQGVVLKRGVLVEDGVFVLGATAIPGTKLGSFATVAVRAWDATSGATFDAAVQKGSEDIVVGPLGGDISPPAPFDNFRSFTPQYDFVWVVGSGSGRLNFR